MARMDVCDQVEQLDVACVHCTSGDDDDDDDDDDHQRRGAANIMEHLKYIHAFRYEAPLRNLMTTYTHALFAYVFSMCVLVRLNCILLAIWSSFMIQGLIVLFTFFFFHC